MAAKRKKKKTARMQGSLTMRRQDVAARCRKAFAKGIAIGENIGRKHGTAHKTAAKKAKAAAVKKYARKKTTRRKR